MAQDVELGRIAYPPAPWHLSGRLWAGAFRTDRPVPLPDGLRHALGSRMLVVVLARYLEGTLSYDELAIGVPALQGARPGLFVDHMWVNNQTSVEGGRGIWGLPKQFAEFAWDGRVVRVTDGMGLVAAVTVDGPAVRLPWLWLPVPAIGRIDGQWAVAVGGLRARLGGASIGVGEWSARFPYRPASRPLVGVAAEPFRLNMPPPTLLGDRPKRESRADSVRGAGVSCDRDGTEADPTDGTQASQG